MMRFIDAFQAFPSFMLSLVLVFFLGPRLFNAMVAVGVASIPGYCRTMRGSVLSAKENEYVETILGRRRYLKDINSKKLEIYPH